MNQYWKIREELVSTSIDDVEKLLLKQYKRAYEDISEKMSVLYYKILSEAGTEKALVSDLYKYNRYYNLMNELNDRLHSLGLKEKRTLSKEMEYLYSNTFKIVGQEVNFNTNLNEDLVKKALADVWTPDGIKWSERIWTNKAQLQQSLSNGLVDCLATGASPDKLTEMVMQRCNASYANANRLARTELSHIYNKAALDKYTEAGITKYMYLAGAGERTCEKCGSLDGQVFKLEDAEVGVNYPPLHTNCRCTVIAKE